MRLREDMPSASERYHVVFVEGKTIRSGHSSKREAERVCRQANNAQKRRLGYELFMVVTNENL
jgi:hypothetical protein